MASSSGKGVGFKVTEREIKSIFEAFDPERKGLITMTGLRHKLSILMPGFAPRDLSSLFGGSTEITEAELCHLLMDNEFRRTDPVQLVFDSLISAQSNGTRSKSRPGLKTSDDKDYLDVSLLADIFESLGMGHLSAEEIGIILNAGDFDGDGGIGLSDFRRFVDLSENLTQHHTTAAQREYLKGTGADPFSSQPGLGAKLAAESRKLVHKSMKIQSNDPSAIPTSDNNRFLSSIITKTTK